MNRLTKVTLPLWLLMVTVASVAGCSRVPNPFVYYPILSYLELAKLDPDSAAAMRDDNIDTSSGYVEELNELRVIDPRTRTLVLRVEKVEMFGSNDRYHTGDADFYPLKDLRVDESRQQLPMLLGSLRQSGWNCVGLEEALVVLGADGTLNPGRKIACGSPLEHSAASLSFETHSSPPLWHMRLFAPLNKRCTMYPPDIYAKVRGLYECEL